MVDDGSMLDGDENLRATGRAALVLVSAATLLELGIAPGSTVTVAGPRGSITLPVGVAALADDVVWVPSSSGGTNVNRDLGLAGSAVRLVGGTA
jgi:NADH-quinone oxidoreductase subunit G